jgi:hypothetical protein
VDYTACSTWSSCICLRTSDEAGGIYAVTKLILELSGKLIRRYIAYSFSLVASICNYERTYTASPPLWPLSLLDSTKLKPGMLGFMAPYPIHVS